jgi:copper chaperone CopZ
MQHGYVYGIFSSYLNMGFFDKFKKTKNDESGKVYKIEGMHCVACATLIESDLEDAGFPAVCNFQKKTLTIKKEAFDREEVKKIVRKTGYNLV